MTISHRSALAALAAALCVGTSSVDTQAASIGINPTTYPIDIVSGFIPLSYTYNPATQTGTFSTGAGGVTQSIRTSVGGATTNLTTMGQFSLNASFLVSDNTLNASLTNLSGSVLLTGGVNPGDPVHTLMASNSLQQVGFSNGGGMSKTFEFIFAPGTGDFGSLGPINIVLHTTMSGATLSNYNAGYMTASWGPIFSTADAVVPLPPAVFMAASSLGGLALLRLRRRIHQA